MFEIAYFVAKLDLPFTTYENLCGLEMKHCVDLGKTYRNDKACKNFVLTSNNQRLANAGEDFFFAHL